MQKYNEFIAETNDKILTLKGKHCVYDLEIGIKNGEQLDIYSVVGQTCDAERRFREHGYNMMKKYDIDMKNGVEFFHMSIYSVENALEFEAHAIQRISQSRDIVNTYHNKHRQRARQLAGATPEKLPFFSVN